MFRNHEYFRFHEIELYVLLQQPQLSVVVDPSQVSEKTNDNHIEVDGIDEEEDETHVDFMVNDDSAHQEHEPLPMIHVYVSPVHMTNLNLEEDEPASDIFHNMYMQTEEALQVGDKFHTKEECVRAIKKVSHGDLNRFYYKSYKLREVHRSMSSKSDVHASTINIFQEKK